LILIGLPDNLFLNLFTIHDNKELNILYHLEYML
jgi:hypothetical protein